MWIPQCPGCCSLGRFPPCEMMASGRRFLVAGQGGRAGRVTPCGVPRFCWQYVPTGRGRQRCCYCCCSCDFPFLPPCLCLPNAWVQTFLALGVRARAWQWESLLLWRGVPLTQDLPPKTRRGGAGVRARTRESMSSTVAPPPRDPSPRTEEPVASTKTSPTQGEDHPGEPPCLTSPARFTPSLLSPLLPFLQRE